MAQTTSVLWSVDQGLGEEEQSQARLNIGAASSISINTLKSALNRLSNTVQDISYKVAVNDREITEIKSKLAPHIGNGTVAYNATGDNLICELSACKVYCNINTTNYCQIKVTANDTTIKADQSIIHSINGNFDGFRIYNTPWNNAGSYMVTANIPYDNNNYGTIDIDIMTSDDKLIHLIIWYQTGIDNKYQFTVTEEVKS